MVVGYWWWWNKKETETERKGDDASQLLVVVGDERERVAQSRAWKTELVPRAVHPSNERASERASKCAAVPDH